MMSLKSGVNLGWTLTMAKSINKGKLGKDTTGYKNFTSQILFCHRNYGCLTTAAAVAVKATISRVPIVITLPRISRFSSPKRNWSDTASPTATAQALPSPEEDEILVHTENKICRITLNRPDKRNAFNADMLQKFLKAIYFANEDDENVTLIVIAANGPYFTSGIDLVSFNKPKPASASDQQQQQSTTEQKKPKWNPARGGVQFFISTLANCKKPLIALINGPTLGFGVTMLGLFDSIYANEDKATFHTQFTKFGLPPELGSTLTFPNIMGSINASKVLLFNHKITTAKEAYDYGLVSQLYPDLTFEQDTKKKLNELAQLPLKSLIYTKELVRGCEIDDYMKQSQDEQKHFNPKMAAEVKKKYAEKLQQQKI